MFRVSVMLVEFIISSGLWLILLISVIVIRVINMFIIDVVMVMVNELVLLKFIECYSVDE